MTVIFINSFHAIKPPIYKFPLTFQGALLLFFFSFECVLRYSALFIKYADPNELLTGARLSISSLRECFIISRLLAFFGCRVAIYSSGSESTPPPHALTQSTFTLSDVWEQNCLICHASAPWQCRFGVGQGRVSSPGDQRSRSWWLKDRGTQLACAEGNWEKLLEIIHKNCLKVFVHP